MYFKWKSVRCKYGNLYGEGELQLDGILKFVKMRM